MERIYYSKANTYRLDIRVTYSLGLYYVHSIVEKHGWNISVESEQSKGTVFTIYGL